MVHRKKGVKSKGGKRQRWFIGKRGQKAKGVKGAYWTKPF